MTPARPSRRWSTAGRIAVRDLKGNARSSLLISLLIALPIAIGTAFVFVSTNAGLTLEQRYEQALGGADARITLIENIGPSTGQLVESTQQTVTNALGPNTQNETIVEIPSAISAGESTVGATGVLLTTGSEITEPLYLLLEGESPSAPGEVAISQAVAERVGVGIGDQVRVPGVEEPFRITGIQLDVVNAAATFFTMPQTLETIEAVASGSPGDQLSIISLVTAGPEQLAASTLPFLDRQAIDDGTNDVGMELLLPALLGVTVLIAITTISCFTAVSRRQRQKLGMLSLIGADRRLRRSVTFFTSLILAVAGVLAGLVVGTLAALAIFPVLRARSGQAWNDPVPPLIPLCVLVLISLVCAVVTAALTARSVAKFSAREALGGREKAANTNTPTRILPTALSFLLGVAAVLAGAASDTVPLIIVGAFGVAITLSLLVIQLLRRGFAGNVVGPVWLRLTVRDTVRAPTRVRSMSVSTATAGTLGALVAFLLSSLALGGSYVPTLPSAAAQFTSSQQVPSRAIEEAAEALDMPQTVQYRPAVRETSGGTLSYLQVANPLFECAADRASQGTVDLTACAESTGFDVFSPKVVLASPDELEALLGERLSPEVVEQFADGAALVKHPELLTAEGTIEISSGAAAVNAAAGTAIPGQANNDSFELDAVVAGDDQQTTQAPAVIIPQELIGQFGIQPGLEWNVLFRGDSTPTTDEQDRALPALLAATAGDGQLAVERGDQTGNIVQTVVLISAATIAAAIITIVTLFIILSNLQVRREAAILSAIGINRKVRRQISAAHSVLAAAVALVVSLVVGTWGASLVVAAEGADFSWTALPLLLVVSISVLAVAYIAGWLSSPATTRAPRTLE